MKLVPLTLKPTKNEPFNYEPSKSRSARDVDLSEYKQKTIIVSGKKTTVWTNGYGWFLEQ